MCVSLSVSGWAEGNASSTAPPSLAQQQALLLSLLPVGGGGWRDPRASFQGLLRLGGRTDRRDRDRTQLCPGLSKGHRQAMRGRLGACKCLHVCTSGFACGSPWVGWSGCLSRYICERLGLFMSVCEHFCMCVSVWGCLGVSTAACGAPHP